MRATCESCARPQPVDWRPGDLCVECGLVVRVEARCYWCANWGPEGKFCRKCGAASVTRENYAPARMLKHMGASIFEVPRLLAELDPDQIETYRSMYAAHAAVANRHVETVRDLGQRLYQRHWAQELEDALIPQLPWSDETLAANARDSKPEESPFANVREVAELDRLQSGAFAASSGNLLQSVNAAIAAEAALQLSGWRFLYGTHTGVNRHDLIAALLLSPLPLHASPRLAALGHKPQPAYALTGDPDTDFLIVLLDENILALEQALDHRDPMRRVVAAAQLIRLNSAAAIGPVLRAADSDQQLLLLRDIVRYKRAIPALRDTYFHLFANNRDYRVCRAAAEAITLNRQPADLLELIEISDGDHAIIHTVLRSKPAPATYAEIGRRLVQSGKFNADQWGMDAAAKPDAMPPTFVADNYPHATAAVQCHLLRFAEKQIEALGEERSSLERLLIRQCFTGAGVEVIGTAWACIHRIQMHRQVGLTVPCDLSLENVAWCWSMPEILTAIAQLMANPEAVEQTFVRDDFSRFLRSAGEDFFQSAAHFPDECRRVINAAPLADPYTYALRFAAELNS